MDSIFFAKSNGVIPFTFSSRIHLQIPSRRDALRCRALRGKLGFQILSPRCFTFQDSVLQSSVFMITATVAAFAAIELVQINCKRGGSESEGSQQEIFDALLSVEQSYGTNIPQKEWIGKQVLSSETLSKLPSNCERMNFVCKAPKIISSTKDPAFVCKDGELLNSQTTGLPLNVLNDDLHPVDEPFALFPTASMFAQTKVDGSKDPLLVGEIKSRETDGLVLDKSDNIPGKQEKALSGSNMYSLKDFHISNCFVIPVVSKPRELHQNNYHGTHHIANESELLDSNLEADHHRCTKEAYDCDKEQLDVRSLSSFSSLKEKPLGLFLQSDSVYYDLKLSVKRAEVLEKRSSNSTAHSDFPQRQAFFMCFKKAFDSNEKGLTNDRSSTHDIGKSLMWRQDNKHLSRFFQPNGGFVKDSSSLETCLRTYECLLRDARLKDCLDLLEGMKRKGLLDMEKVHHTRFLNACKSQKAAEEAFRFCKLINKPTLSTFNMLLSVCANAQDFDGAFEVMLLIKDARLKPDCKLYTTLISACGKCGKVDAMFEVFHEMVNAGIEPNVNTYGALIDGCARAGQVAKAFGAYGIMRSKERLIVLLMS